MSTIMQGTTADCLQHFLQAYNWRKTQDFVAAYIGVGKDTVLRWRDGALPSGERLLKVRVMLDLYGYEVNELSQLPDLNGRLARMLALGVLSYGDARRWLGYNHDYGVGRLVMDGSTVSRERKTALRNLVSNDELVRELVEAARAARERLNAFKLLIGEPHRADHVEKGSLEEPAATPTPASDAVPEPADPVTANEEPELPPSDASVPLPSATDDDEALAYALVDAIRLTRSLAHAIDCKPAVHDICEKVRFAVGDEGLYELIVMLGNIRNP